jgi:mono/diheme cytochrome c family protein
MNRITLLIVVVGTLVMSGRPLTAEDLRSFPPEQVQTGSAIYERNCSGCHGQHMANPDADLGAFDLRQFPRDEHDRFVTSVTAGKNFMPPWGGRIKPAEIEALWAYVCAGEK